MYLLKKLSKVALSTSNDKIIQSTDSIETYAYRTRSKIFNITLTEKLQKYQLCH